MQRPVAPSLAGTEIPTYSSGVSMGMESPETARDTADDSYRRNQR
jgi:hypothetical protein